jgi:hypothetical protein
MSNVPSLVSKNFGKKNIFLKTIETLKSPPIKIFILNIKTCKSKYSPIYVSSKRTILGKTYGTK